MYACFVFLTDVSSTKYMVRLLLVHNLYIASNFNAVLIDSVTLS